MAPTLIRLAGITLLGIAAAAPGLADSLTSSAASAGSASVGSLSDSITGSSNASSPNTPVADGDYRVIEVAALAERPGMLRLALQALPARDDSASIRLTLPQQALAQRALVPGDIVSARRRPYGIEFAHAGNGAAPRQAFFLLLADDWMGELAPHAVSL